MSKLASKLVELARAEVGVRESPPGSNCGPRVNEYKAATWLPADKPWPWCAGFICWLVMQAMRATGVKETLTFKRPQTAGAWDFERWSKQQDKSTHTKLKPWTDIKPGDIVIFTFSHIGLATGVPTSDGMFDTIEGNTNDAGEREGLGVQAKRRHVNQVRSRIRFTV